MPESLIFTIGLAGQGAFFLRFFLQWLASEKRGRIVVPRIFWTLSIVGSVFALIYAIERRDLVFAAGTVTNFFVYLRNMLLDRGFRRLSERDLGIAAVLLAMAALTILTTKIPRDASLFWSLVGAMGVGLWALRFPLQWVQSERRGQPVMTTTFFAVSFVGSLFLLAYALHTGDTIFILGMVLVPILALRNLVLSRRRAGDAPVTGAAE